MGNMNWLISTLEALQHTNEVLLGFAFAWLIFYLQQGYAEKKEKQRVINAFVMEIKRNRMTCNVANNNIMQVSYFDLDAWTKIKTGNYIPIRSNMIFYVYQIENANRLISDFRVYQKDNVDEFLPLFAIGKTFDDMRIEANSKRTTSALKSALKELAETIPTTLETLGSSGEI